MNLHFPAHTHKTTYYQQHILPFILQNSKIQTIFYLNIIIKTQTNTCIFIYIIFNLQNK